MSTGDILYYDLLGVILLFTADVFHLWDPWARVMTALLERMKARISAVRRR